jgi:hypothetical protein
MASYGTARAYTQILGEKTVARLLAQTLKEEKAADRTLTLIGEGGVNEEAAEEWQSQVEDNALTRTAEWAGRTAVLASQRVGRGVRQVATMIGAAQDRAPARKTERRGEGPRQRNRPRGRRRTTAKKR